ncbi:MAG: hypothetical protein KKA65_00240 [Nanoarchaeota archaeon]|nr:hypothetical protein [Nanoarchaeota archaeon]MBU4351757.1 hypothetical protein [Nanoarchaeota archaeon]MBU4455914.1 hypothetical protein [Nanoarchaeota archaeon]
MAVDDKVKKIHEELKEKWLPIFRVGYGADAIIEDMECVRAGIHGTTYRIFVKNPEGKEGEHYLRLLPGNNHPAMIDGVLTQEGQNYVDFWSEHGKVVWY